MPGYHVKTTKTPPPSPKSWMTGKLKKRKVERKEAMKSLDVDEQDSFQSDLPTTMGRIGAVVGGYKGYKSNPQREVGIKNTREFKTEKIPGGQLVNTAGGAWLGSAAGTLAGHGVHTAMREYKIWKEKRRLKKKKQEEGGE